MMLIEFALSETRGFLEVIVRQSEVDDFVAMVFEAGWLAATRGDGPTLEEEDSHQDSSSLQVFHNHEIASVCGCLRR